MQKYRMTIVADNVKNHLVEKSETMSRKLIFILCVVDDELNTVVVVVVVSWKVGR